MTDEDLDYYSPAPVKALTPRVKEFPETAFSRCIPRAKRRHLTMEYPRPDITATKVPKMDTVFRSALGRNTADWSDEQLAKVQATILAACAPLANLWSHMDSQGLRASPGETMPTGDVFRVARDTLALIGNASCYISHSSSAASMPSIQQ